MAAGGGGGGAHARLLSKVAALYGEEAAPGGAAAPARRGREPPLALASIAADPLLAGAKLSCTQPRRKVTVMVIGNHSAGKSSLINWYCGDSVQREGVAIETRGFTLVSHGARRETLRGEATKLFFPHLAATVDGVEGLVDSLTTEISPSTAHSFKACDLIDTPGLVDGSMEYGMDVEAAICALAEHVDLILVLFDPIGQALCKRTMEVVERLSGTHYERMRFFVSKADQVESEVDRQTVLIQITQNLSARLANTDNFALKLPTIYRPLPEGDPRAEAAKSIPNGIYDLVALIDKTITQTVQTNLVQLKGDSRAVSAAVEERLAANDARRASNGAVRRYGVALYLLSLALLATTLLLSLVELLRLPAVGELLDAHGPKEAVAVLQQLPGYVSAALGVSAAEAGVPFGPAAVQRLGAAAAAWLASMIVMKAVWVEAPAMSRADGARLAKYKAFCDTLEVKREQMYAELFRSITAGDEESEDDTATIDTTR